ncbi:MAG: hypothetical protein WC043_10825 [Pseudobdellovibrionaceae bacterium]
MPNTPLDLIGWWIAVIEIPVISALFWMLTRLRDELATHRIEVAKNYAQISEMRILENRLTSHLLRIEAKLDVTALKTERIHHD